jgi:hypothetical protein
MIRVVVESPLGAPTREQIEDNKRFAVECCKDCLKRGEAPYASHLFYDRPGLLDDQIPDERELGITAGLLWGDAAEKTVVYMDRGISQGMTRGILRARDLGRPIEYRRLDDSAFRFPDKQ